MDLNFDESNAVEKNLSPVDGSNDGSISTNTYTIDVRGIATITSIFRFSFWTTTFGLLINLIGYLCYCLIFNYERSLHENIEKFAYFPEAVAFIYSFITWAIIFYSGILAQSLLRENVFPKIFMCAAFATNFFLATFVGYFIDYYVLLDHESTWENESLLSKMMSAGLLALMALLYFFCHGSFSKVGGALSYNILAMYCTTHAMYDHRFGGGSKYHTAENSCEIIGVVTANIPLIFGECFFPFSTFFQPENQSDVGSGSYSPIGTEMDDDRNEPKLLTQPIL